MAADRTLVQGAQAVAGAKNQAVSPAAAGFVKGFSKSAEKLAGLVEQNIKKKRAEDTQLLEFADQRTSIDMSAVTDPEYRGAITDFLAEGKNEYAAGANLAVANSEDPFGSGYTEGKNKMQAVNDHTAVAVKQIAKFDQMRNAYAEQITNNGKLPEGLSEEERNIANAIFKGDADMKIDKSTGKMSFTVNGKTIDFDTYKFPTDELPEVLDFEQKQLVNVLEAGRPMSAGEVAATKAGFEKMLATRSGILGILKEKRGDIPAPISVKGAVNVPSMDIELARTASEEAYNKIYTDLEAAKENGEYPEDALARAANATAGLMANDLQAKSNEQYQGRLKYSESFGALENDGSRFEAKGFIFEKGKSGKFIVTRKSAPGRPLGAYESIADIKMAFPDVANTLK